MPGPARNLTPEQERTIAELFRGGASIADIHRQTAIPKTTISRTLTRQGIVREDNHLTDAQRETLVGLVEAGLSRDEIAENLSITPDTVSRTLKRFGLKMTLGRRQRPLRHDAFNTVTPESAYWMGFLFTDGSIQQDDYGKPFIAVNISAKDRTHLEKFRAFLGSDHAITDTDSGFKNETSCVYFKVRSERLVAALQSHGMAWKKPERVPVGDLAMSRDFWRGVFDADGTISISSDGYAYAKIHLCGHRPMLMSFLAFGRRHGVDSLNIIDMSTICGVAATGQTAMTILATLYDGACVAALERKLEDAREILHPTSRHRV